MALGFLFAGTGAVKSGAWVVDCTYAVDETVSLKPTFFLLPGGVNHETHSPQGPGGTGG